MLELAIRALSQSAIWLGSVTKHDSTSSAGIPSSVEQQSCGEPFAFLCLLPRGELGWILDCDTVEVFERSRDLSTGCVGSGVGVSVSEAFCCLRCSALSVLEGTGRTWGEVLGKSLEA